MHLLRTVDLKGNAIHGPAVYITVLTAHSIGGGLDVIPGKVMLVDKSTANARIHSGMAREATPEEIALFEAEKARDLAALSSAQAEDDEAARIAAEQAFEAEVSRRLGEKLEGMKAELLAKIESKAGKEAVEKVFAAAAEANDDAPPPLDGITHGDPRSTHRDPSTSG